MGEIKPQIIAFLRRFYRKDEIGEDENIFERGYVNSLFAMQLVMFIENEFQIQISNEDLDLENFQSINRIVSFIESKR